MNSLLSKKELRDAHQTRNFTFTFRTFYLSGSRSGYQDPHPESGSSDQNKSNSETLIAIQKDFVTSTFVMLAESEV
jgi:hypothetical protein